MQATAEAIPLIPSPPSRPETGQRVILRGVSWTTYERLLADFQDSHAAHFTYDQGVLEITVLSAEHEAIKHALALLVDVLAEELNINVYGFGSTTFRQENLHRGFEPDACFYIQHGERVRGKKKLDLTVDPPPDLVIEVDITSPSLNRMTIYAALGVPEVWRYDGAHVTIACLSDGTYSNAKESTALPKVSSGQLS
jgi:Uma2 family endonuclease